MCGIAGMLNLDGGPPPAIEDLARMIGAIRHRGPDDLGVYRDAHVGLAHARLAIIDREGGKQPLSDAAGEIWVSYNGEIYNHVELRAELESRGYAFRTRSDTEVLVAAYRAFGDDCVERFEGQFAFALWDARRRRLLLARDRFGVRPLHVARVGNRLLFASEVKALFQIDEVPRALDPQGLAQVFHIFHVGVDGIVARVGFVGFAGAALVVEDHLDLGGQGAHGHQVVVRKPRPTVEKDRRLARFLAVDFIVEV